MRPLIATQIGKTREHEKFLQIVLFGQPELDHVLSKPAIRPLKDRITNRFYLAPFKQYQIREYVNVSST